jgi:hypothetical protein
VVLGRQSHIAKNRMQIALPDNASVAASRSYRATMTAPLCPGFDSCERARNKIKLLQRRCRVAHRAMNEAKEVWITGIGIVSSLGEGLDAHWEALAVDLSILTAAAGIQNRNAVQISLVPILRT